jgi:hypothetical protein
MDPYINVACDCWKKMLVDIIIETNPRTRPNMPHTEEDLNIQSAAAAHDDGGGECMA